MGDRMQAMAQAVRGLCAQPSTSLIQTTAIYETAPWVGSGGDPNQPWYLNAMVAIETPLLPEALLTLCQHQETQQGRQPAVERQHNGPRVLDVDILWCDAFPAYQSPTLTLPHPRFATRACTLVPLLEHWGEWVHPTTGQTLLQLHQALPSVEPVRLHSVAPWGALLPVG